MDNTSGQGKNSVVPREIKRWNWGAFLLNWTWGIGNNTFIALLTLLPFLNLVMIFALGLKGNEWAWQNKKWESIEEFNQTQRSWTKWAIVLYLSFFFVFGSVIYFVDSYIENTDVYKLTVNRINLSPEVARTIGTPIETSFPSATYKNSDTSGWAKFAIPINGSMSSGIARGEATKRQGKWQIDHLVVETESGQTLDLTKQP